MEESAQHGAEGLNVDPNKKGRARLTLEERNFQAARAKIERELEQVLPGDSFMYARQGCRCR
eukprot:1358679-Rhodomonas_salina.4